jgi:hypothetical protein
MQLRLEPRVKELKLSSFIIWLLISVCLNTVVLVRLITSLLSSENILKHPTWSTRFVCTTLMLFCLTTNLREPRYGTPCYIVSVKDE